MRLLVALVACLAAPIANAWDTPRKAIDEFLKFELGGGRLQSWPFTKYLAVPPDYDEPGWDEVELIEEAKVLPLSCSETRCQAPVEFTFTATRGKSLQQVTEHPNGGKQTLTYVVVKRKGQWLIENSNGLPRVSYKAYKKLYPNGL
jgi:hypothetical protein